MKYANGSYRFTQPGMKKVFENERPTDVHAKLSSLKACLYSEVILYTLW